MFKFLKRLFTRRAKTAIIVWPAIYSTNHPADEPHCTVAYLGDVTTIGKTKEQVASIIRNMGGSDVYYNAKVTGTDQFGADGSVPVLLLDSSSLWWYRQALVTRLGIYGVNVDKTFDFIPHVTMSELEARFDNHPYQVMLGPVELWWGKEHIKIGR